MEKSEPIVKVYGVIIDKEHSSNINYITSIFYKVVPEFSYNKDELNEDKHLIFQKVSDEKG